MSYAQRLLSFYKYLRWAVRTGKVCDRPDVVFASSTPLTVGEIGRKVAVHHRTPFVFEVRDVWPEVPIALGALNNPVLRWFAFRMARRVDAAADRIVALSPDMKSMLANRRVPASKISVIPNCCDTDLFGADTNREAVRHRHGWGDKLICIHPGAMGLVNGLDYALDAAKHLDSMGEEKVHIALFGQGRFRNHLAARIETEGIRSVSIHDPVPKTDMPDLLSAADVGLMTVLDRPHLSANSANKFFDFLAAGLPVVINYNGWQKRLLEQADAGSSCDSKRPEHLASTLMGLAEDVDKRERMGKAARQLAETRFDRKDLVRQLEAVLASAGADGEG
jgi:glycosyltransferase involved in cell wall biosynthesis